MTADAILLIITLWAFLGAIIFTITTTECVPLNRRKGVKWWIACILCGPVALMIGAVMSCGAGNN